MRRNSEKVALAEVHALLGHSLLDVADADGVVPPGRPVTDNGASVQVRRLRQVYPPHGPSSSASAPAASPRTPNGVRKRAFGSLKCEKHLYRHEITDGPMLADHAERYGQIFNTIRPHEALNMRRPQEVYLTDSLQLSRAPKPSQISDAGQPTSTPGRGVEPRP